MDQFLEQWSKIPLYGKFLIVLGIWALLAGGYYYNFYTDQVRIYRSQATLFQKERDERIKLEAIAKNLPRWESEVSRLTGELAKASTLLPTNKEIPSLLKKVDDLASKSGLKIIQIRPKNDRKRKFYADVPLDMTVKGTFYELMVFFDKVSNLDRIVNIARIRFRNPKLINQKLTLAANFQIITYRFLARK